jgi:hypothetical protein
MIASIQSSYRHDTKNIIVAAQSLSTFQVTPRTVNGSTPALWLRSFNYRERRDDADTRNATDQFSAPPNNIHRRS